MGRKTDNLDDLQIRFASAGDVPLLLRFIRELAAYEGLTDEVSATEALLREWMFEKGRAEALIGERGGEPVAFALFFYSFSTFLGRAGIYLEDLYVSPEARGRGVGTKLLSFLAKLAVERGCGRLEWSCLDWNRDSVAFYLSLGAKAMDGWTVYRLAGDTLQRLAERAAGAAGEKG